MKRRSPEETKENERPTKVACLICDKDKFVKRSRSRERTVPIEQSAETLKEYATKVNDL
jgi:deoxyadenosine/deoxycytidine kinase